MIELLGKRRVMLLAAVAVAALVPGAALAQASATPPAAPTPAAQASPWADLASAPPDIRPMTPQEQGKLAGASGLIGMTAYQSAAKGWEDALKLHEATYGPDHPRTAFIRVRLAEHWIDLRRYAEAQAQLDLADAALAARAPPGHPLRLAALSARSLLMGRQHRNADQIAVAEKTLVELEAGVATAPAYRTGMASWRGLIAARKGDYRTAEAQYRAYYDAIVAQPGATISDRGSAADGLARQLIVMGRRREAAALLAPLVAEAGADEKANAAVLATMLEGVGEIAADQNQFIRADTALRKARLLRKDDELLNPERASATRIALRMARLLRAEDRFDAPFMIGGADEKFGSGLDLHSVPPLYDAISALTVEATADAYTGEAIWADEVLPLRRKLLDWYEQKFGPDHPETARVRRALAGALADMGKPFSAERELQRALAVQRAALPGPNEELGRSLTLLGRIYVAQGRRPEALAAYGEAVRNLEAPGGKDSFWTRDARFGQAQLAGAIGDRPLADATWKRLYDTAAFDPDEVGTLTLRQLMATLQGYVRNQIDHGTCMPAAERKQLGETIEGFHKIIGGRAGIVETGLYTLAEAEACAGNFDVAARAIDGAKTSTFGMSAEDFGRDAENVAIRNVRLVRAFISDTERMKSDRIETTPEPGNPGVVGMASFQSAATIGMELGRAELAARNLLVGAGAQGGGDLDAIRARSQQEAGGRNVFDFVFSTRLDFDWKVHELRDGPGPVLNQDNAILRSGYAIGAAQDLEHASAAQVLAQASARLGSKDNALGALLREREKLSGDQRRLDATLATAVISAVPGATGPTPDDLRKQSEAALTRLGTLDAQLLKDYPDYFALTKPDSLSIAAIQEKLSASEGLLLVQPNGADLHVFVVTKRRVAWKKLAGASGEVAALVDSLRCDIDAATCREEGLGGSRGASRGAKKLRSGTPSAPGIDPGELAMWKAPSFDRNKAWRLNQLILEPLAPVLAKDEVFGDEVTRLYTVVGGPLSALPLGLLLTAKLADGGQTTTGAALHEAPWLANKYTLIGLPSVASLALKPPPAAGGGAMLVGYGDPVLVGEPEGEPQARSILNMVAREDDFLRARPDALRKMDPLPGTETELKAVAGLFPSGSAMVRLQGAATETAVKHDPALAKARIVIFSTHGLLPGEAVGDVEPGLVLTPPDLASDLDDGLLTASEAATLDLDADLLVLSACNTATTDGTPGAESLSSLSRAFLYAGARGIYASHWRVSDDVTARLITIALGLRRDGKTRAEALSLAMKAVRSGTMPDGSAVPGWTPDWAHPAAWAPFVVLSGYDG